MRIVILCILIIFAAAAPAHAFLGLFGAEEQVTARDGLITVDVSKISTGEAKHYKFTENSLFIRFFIVRDKQDVIRVAQDACEVCWREDKGYKLQDGMMVCINCGMKFPLARIGMTRGGCNPHPVTFSLDGEKVIMTAKDLLGGAKLHPGNKI